MTQQRDEQLTKRVDFVAKDEDQQVASGIVMVPNKVDLQGDWEQPETIEQFAQQFENLYEAGEADGGIMHAAWPSEWMELEDNRVLESAEEIGGVEAPAGAWVQDWAFNKDELWGLVDDGILEGYSIGAINVDWQGPMAQDDLPDEVSVPDSVDEEAPVWELVSGMVREVSAVDIPAVPDAMILETKADAEKRLSEHLGNRDGFVEEAKDRGHSEAEAERLWDVLNDAVDVDGAGDPGKQSMWARAGKAFFTAFSGTDDGSDAAKSPEDQGKAAEKEGRTLSRQNRESLYATIDASLDVLQDAGDDHGMTRFTDRDDVSFDLSEHSARNWASDGGDEDEDEDEDDEEEEEEESTIDNAAGGETPGSGSTDAADDMTDDNENTEPPEWAKSIQEQLDEQSKRIDDVLEGDEEKDADDDPMEEAPEWAKSLKEDVDKQSERIDAISKQTGTDSQQIGTVKDEDEKESGFTLDPRKAGGN